MTSTTRYGLLGSGMMGQEHIRNIALLPDTAVTAILEPDAGMRAVSATLAPEAVFVDRLEDLLARIDVLVIASPNDAHVAQLAEIARIRRLPVLVEKPLCTRRADHAILADLAEGWGHPFWVAMEYRYMPPIAMLVAEAAAATGGIRMLTIREHRFPFLVKVGNWNRFNHRTGGTLVEKCCHFFDLMRLITGQEAVRIAASGGQAVNFLDERHGGQQADVWDHAYVIVDFDGGARAMLDLCMFAEGARFQEEVTAVGPVGRIEARVPGPQRFWPVETLGPPPIAEVEVAPREPKGPRVLEVPVDPRILAAGDHNGGTFYQHERFLAAVRSGAPVEVSWQDGWRAVQMGLAAQAAAAAGRVATLEGAGFRLD